MISLLAKGLVLAGVPILVGSALTTWQLVMRLGTSPVRKRWYAMLALIVVFVVGYLGYLWAFWNEHAAPLDLIVPAIFFLGACFVWLTASLSLQTAVAVMRVGVLEHENVTDALTGTFNRRFLDARLKEEISRARRYAMPFSVLLIDIDHFKRVNDTHGHPAGDKVLQDFAGLLKKQLRDQDLLARYGGEEFMVLAPHTPQKGATDLAERLRASIAAQQLHVPSPQGAIVELRVSCSIGVASLEALGAQPDPVETLLRAADANLYRAKSGGRNRVVAGDAPN